MGFEFFFRFSERDRVFLRMQVEEEVAKLTQVREKLIDRLPLRPDVNCMSIADVKLFLRARDVLEEDPRERSEAYCRYALSKEFARRNLIVNVNLSSLDDMEILIQCKARGRVGIPNAQQRRRVLEAIVAKELERRLEDSKEPMFPEILPLLSKDDLKVELKRRNFEYSDLARMDRSKLRLRLAEEWNNYVPAPWTVPGEHVSDDVVRAMLLRRGSSTQGAVSTIRDRLGAHFAVEHFRREIKMKRLLKGLQTTSVRLLFSFREFRTFCEANSTSQHDPQGRSNQEIRDALIDALNKSKTIRRQCDLFCRDDEIRESIRDELVRNTKESILSNISKQHREEIERAEKSLARYRMFETRMSSLNLATSYHCNHVMLELLREAREASQRALDVELSARTHASYCAQCSIEAASFAKRKSDRAYAKLVSHFFLSLFLTLYVTQWHYQHIHSYDLYLKCKTRIEQEREHLQATKERREMLHLVLNRALDIRRDERELKWSENQEDLKVAERERYMAEASEVREAYEDMKDPSRVKVSSPTTRKANLKNRLYKDVGTTRIPKSNNSKRHHRITLMTFITDGKVPCCPNAHDMDLVSKSNAPYLKFICDEKQCARRSKGTRWHCKSCGVDYCLICYPESAFKEEHDTADSVAVEIGQDVSTVEEDARSDSQYDENALLEIPVLLDRTDFRPTWYHDTSHIPKESHNVYFKKKKNRGSVDKRKNKESGKRF